MITLSPSARAAVEELRPGERLRIVFAGGCGALGFRLSVARRVYPGDHQIEVDGLTLLLDDRARGELSGVVLDYDDDDGFVLDHPAWGLSC